MGDDLRMSGHEKFREICALAPSGTLLAEDWAELSSHLEICPECRELYNQYCALVVDGVPQLAARYSNQEEQNGWDDTTTRRRLYDRVRELERHESSVPVGSKEIPSKSKHPTWIVERPLVRVAVAACLIVAVALGAYYLGGSTKKEVAKQAQGPAADRFQPPVEKAKPVNAQLAARLERLPELERQGAQKEHELVQLRAALVAAEDRVNNLASEKTVADEQLRTISGQRDALGSQLHEAERAYQSVQLELASLRSERDQAQVHTASLESRIEKLSTTNREQERKLRDADEFLASDRDIRELIGARQLYIADVFDVSSDSRTRKPFGRVFYTRGKSLIFYAFDLDRQPGTSNDNTFQAWGRTDSNRSNSLNLGIFYMDKEENRRWVLRYDDPKRLAEIDAVFVTVEPRGGSEKPTGKPYLYALLRKEVNHP